MSMVQPITLALQDLAKGDKQAFDRLIPHVYDELRKLAGYYLRNERNEHTLQPTALVHEAYCRLVDQNQPSYQSRAHFLGVAAHVMRQILTDHARSRKAAKRGGDHLILSLDQSMDASIIRPAAILQVNDALDTLAACDPRKAQLIEMRFFGGMTAEESAAVLELPVQKVRSELRIAQAWLERELNNRPLEDAQGLT